MMSVTPTIASRRPRRLVAICSVIGALIAAWLAYELLDQSIRRTTLP